MIVNKSIIILEKVKLYICLCILILILCIPSILLTVSTIKYKKELENRPIYKNPPLVHQVLIPFYETIKLSKNNIINIDNVIDNNIIKETSMKGFIINDNVIVYDNINGNKIDTLSYNTELTFTTINNNEDWLKIDNGYIRKKDVSINKNTFNEFIIPKYPGFKSYMDYRSVNIPTAIQYKLLTIHGYTDNGFRKVNGRYCIAVGSYFNTSIGQYIDLVLENGVVIQCIMGDLKADVHTDKTNIFTSLNTCCSEFIVDTKSLDPYVAKTGNISNSSPSWNSPVKYIRVYDKNFFDSVGE